METKKRVLKEVKMLQFMAKFIWPVFRLFVKRHLARRCTRCMASERCATLEDGLCEHCRAEAAVSSKRENRNARARMAEQFDSLLREYEARREGRYDALVLFSGGKDSSYLLHRLKTEYLGLRILAFTVNNNFMSPIATDNIKSVIEKLDVDHMTFRPPVSFSRKMFRYAFTHLNERGCAFTVDQFEGDSIFDIARNVAAQQNIPLVIGGISPIQVEGNVGIHWFETPREMETSKREAVAGLRLEDIFDAAEMRFWWDGTRWSEDRIPRVIFPFYAWGYNETEIKAEVVRRGLVLPGKDSPLLTNSQLVTLMALVDNAQFGYSSFEPEFSRLVREGRAERAAWQNMFEMAEYSAKTGKFIKKSIDDILTQLELTRADVGLVN